MIRNDREYEITKARIADFERSLHKLEEKGTATSGHPLIHKAQCDALRSQILDLQIEITEYDELRNGNRASLETMDIDDLPHALIAARIAAGLTQRDLATRLDLSQEDIERSEATEYASATFAQLGAVAGALGVALPGNLFTSRIEVSDRTLLHRLSEAGLDRDFIMRRMVRRNPGDTVGAVDTLRGISNVGRIFGWNPVEMFGTTNQLATPASGQASAYFKIHANAQGRRTALMAAYARYMVSVVLEATSCLHAVQVPQDPVVFRAELLRQWGHIDLNTVMSYLWQLGVVVIPLREGGGFHGACWRVDGRNAIVLKQRTGSEARWLHDLLHEVYHAGAEPDNLEFELIDEESMPLERRTQPEEQLANQFAANVLLDGRAEEFAEECVVVARGSVERLKIAIPKVASKFDIPVGVIANYMAWRLSLQDVDWWGAATNLQADNEDPWGTVRDFLLERLDWSRLKRADRDLLSAMLSED